MYLRIILALAVLSLSFAGCREPSMRTVAENARKKEAYKNRKILTPKNRTKGRSRPASQEDVDLIERAYQAGRATSLGIGRPEDVAVRKATKAIDASLELGPTLVVWMFDRTASSQKLTTAAISAATEYYDSSEIRRLSLAKDQRFLTSVIAYDEKVDFLLDPPSDDWQSVRAALGSVVAVEGGREMTFSAIQQALDKFQALRTTERREVVLILVTDEVGDDQQLCDQLMVAMEKAAIPLYVIGSPAPWGQANPFVPSVDPKLPKIDDAAPAHGPESLFSERVNFSMRPASGLSTGTDIEQELIDSGFGPFSLERLCRASGGEFLTVRPVGNEAYTYRGVSYDFWPVGRELRFEPEVVKRYAPDYVSEDDYKKLLAENKARMALHEAAKLPPTKIDDYPELRFQKGTEAQTAQRLTRAQQFAAKHSPAIDRLYEILQPGEADREKLSSPRWQAQYDFAMGRIAAAKVRVDGYNAMIAALKRGKTFQNPASREWVLEPSETIETGSTQQNMAKKAHMYLDRLLKDHAGTPWAKIAAEEQKVPLGWQWREE